MLLPAIADDAQQVQSESFAAPWIPAAPYPFGIDRFAFIDYGILYVISGRTASGLTTAVNKYENGAWTSLPPIPVASEAPAAALIDNRIYVASGGNAPNALHIYDRTSSNWFTGAPRPGTSGSYGAGVGQYNGKMYVVGGGSNGTTVLSIYDVATDTWSTGPAAPATFQLGGYAQLERFLYLVGTRTSIPAANSTVTMRLDMSTNTWSTGPTWTPARADFGMGAQGTRLFALGGDNNGDGLNPSAEVDELETSGWPGGTWLRSPEDLPSPRQGNRTSTYTGTGFALGPRVFSLGGYNGARLDELLFRAKAPYLCQDYSVTQSTRAFEPGTTDVGNHCDNCLTQIDFPFPFTVYGTTFTSGLVDSNGTLQFKNPASVSDNFNLPAHVGQEATIYPFWDALRTDTPGSGIFTSTTGAAPNRVFTIEWRATAAADATRSTNFALRISEGSADFEVLYGTTVGLFDGTIGVLEHNRNGVQGLVPYNPGLYTQHGFVQTVPEAGTRLLFTTGCCAPIAFRGAIGTNSSTYPGTSGFQTGRLNHDGIASSCGSAKTFPGVFGSASRRSDRYTFQNNGPATCVTFSINTACGADAIFAAAYLGSFTSSNLSANYLGDSGNSPAPFGSFSVNVPANSSVVLVVNEVGVRSGCDAYDVVVTGLSCPLKLVSAASRKTHGTLDFDVSLPITGESGLECRRNGGNHRLVFSFDHPITSGSVSLLKGVATLGAPSFSGSTMIVPISGVGDMQRLVVGLSGVTSSAGQVLPNAGVAMYVLLGEVTGDRVVNSGDVVQTRNRSGQSTDETNFRSDLNTDGIINSGDTLIVRGRSGGAVTPSD